MYFNPEVITLLSGVTSSTVGATKNFSTGKSVDAVRYLVNPSGSTTCTVDIEVSLDGSVWAKAITQIANPGSVPVTGVISGPVLYIRAVSNGATHGTITVQAFATTNP